MRKEEYSEEYLEFLMTDEQQDVAADRFKVFCERATAKDIEWDHFKGTDTYKLVKLLSPEVDDKKLKAARANYDRKTGGIDKDGVHWHTLNALRKVTVAAMHCETPECDGGGMPTSGDKFSTKFFNKRLDRKIDELKELLLENDDGHQSQELEKARTKFAKLSLAHDDFMDQHKILKEENRKLKDNVKVKEDMIENMVSRKMYESVVKSLDNLENSLNKINS
tara:strand:- start:572 stop:1237 length:666 start_codon:yes stop_codon:yes gene_type:complete